MSQTTKIRENAFCVISKATFGENAIHDIQTNTSWDKNPYGNDYAIVPDVMVSQIFETKGYCDITLNQDETEVVFFTAREIPEITEIESKPTTEERLTALEKAMLEQIGVSTE